jgi:hypothetical protein
MMKIFILLIIFIGSNNAADLVATEVLISETKNQVMMDGGNSSIIGGDVSDRRLYTTWFYGNKPVQLCYSYSPSFGAKQERVVDSVKFAIKKWKNYFASKGLSSSDKKSININFNFKGKCKGGEDLKLYFGTGPIFGNLRDLKAVQTLNNPIAYVNKTHMSRDLTWSKGYIRFVGHGYYSSGTSPFPNWNIENSVRSILLHELGHILGFHHIPNTIMDGNISRYLFFNQSKKAQTSIDWKKELVSCAQCQESFKLSNSFPTNNAILKKWGLPANSNLRLVKGRDFFSLVGSSKSIKLKFKQQNHLMKVPVLMTNFHDGQRAFQSSVTYFANTETPERDIVVIQYNSDRKNSDSFISLQTFVSGELKDVAQFNLVR